MKSKAGQGAGKQEASFPIVVVGASAGGLATFERFLSALPGRLGFALIFMQHLSSEYKNLLPDLLRSRAKQFPIEEVSEGLDLSAGKIYLCPPASDVRCEKNLFRVIARPRQHLHLPIDELLASLSEDAPERTIAVILSGAGTDGARGAKAIKARGGTVFVQDPGCAEYPDMPLAAINAAQVDAVLSPEEIAGEIVRFQQSGKQSVPDDAFVSAVQFDSLCRIMDERTGNHFSCYKSGVVARRLRRRMYLRGTAAVDEYLRLLEQNEQEANDLASDILIGVTSFFRDRLAWKALHLEVTRKLAAQEERSPIRVWTAACATGEEAYSIAMMLQHELQGAGRRREFQIFATDVNDRALQRAREGAYPASISADLPPEYLQTYFSSSEDGLSVTVNKELRQRVIFARHNLLTDPPFSRLDLIICRNLLIYLDADAQEKCLSLFHYALMKGGFLFLGNAESPGRTAGLFATLAHKKCRIYQKSESKQASRMSLAMPVASGRPLARPKPEPPREQSTVHVVQEALIEEYAPAAVAINQNYDIVYHNGPTNRFLRPPRGTPTQNLLELLPEKLRSRIRGAVYYAAKDAKPTSIRAGILLDERKKQVVIRVSKVQENLFLLTFREKGSPFEESEAPADETPVDEKVVYQLERELTATRDDLQSHIEEFKSVNEELESSNEELQAANEELETSREELQSLNEELATVNAQLQSKIEEQEETNNDLSNFQTSTNIPTIFLDHRFRVKRFTPAMSKLIALIPADLGRSIMDMAQENLGADLINDARAVLDTLRPVRKELTLSDAAYVRTVLPYRTGDNRIEGVVATYVDITERVRAEEKLRESESRYRELVQNANSAIIRWNADGAITFFNEYAQAFFGYRAREVLGRHVGLLLPEKESTGADLTTLVRDVVNHPEKYANSVNENVRRDGSRVWMAWTNRPIFDENGQLSEILAVGTDISELKRAEKRIRHLSSFPEINPNPVLEFDLSGALAFANPATYSVLERLGVHGKDAKAFLPGDMDSVVAGWDRQTDAFLNREVAIGTRVFDEAIHLVSGFGVARIYGRDITVRKEAEAALQESEQRVRLKLESILSPEGDIGNLELADIIDVGAIQSLMDEFYPLTQAPMAIIDMKGTVLVGEGWQDICTKFHRTHPETCKNCLESDLLLSAGIPSGQSRLYKCKNNMWDVATPIVIGGRQMGNVFSGQFFFQGESIDYETFRAQARQYGFDEGEYLAAIETAPRLSRETVERVVAFLTKLAHMISQLSYSNIKLARATSQGEALAASLRESEEKFRHMFQRHRAVMLLIDADSGEIVDANTAASTYYGYGPEQIRGMNIKDINRLPPGEVETEWRKAAAEQKDHFVFPHRLADNSLRRVEVYSTPLEAAGKTLLFSVIHDVTDRTQAEQEREQSVRFLGIINESSTKRELIHGALMFFKEQSGCEAVGIRLKEGRDYPYYETQGFSEGFVRLESSLCAKDKDGCPVTDNLGRHVVECLCGNVIRARSDPSMPFFTERGSFWTNSTTKLLAAGAGEDRQTRTRSSCNGEGYESVALVALQVGDERVGLLQLNDRRPDRFAPELIGLYERLTGYLAVALAKVEAEEALQRAHDQLEKRVLERTAQLQQAYDKLVTEEKERRQLEEQLRQAQKMEALGTLTGGIAHDFNNILGAIIGFTEIVKDRMPVATNEKHYLERVLEAGLRGRELIKRMLAFSRKTEQERKPVFLSAIVRETMALLRSSTPSTVSIKLEVKSEPRMVLADPVQMQQVVLNLCTNAAQSMKEKGGFLEVEISDAVVEESGDIHHGMKPGRYVRLMVRDTGAGIPQEIIGRVFDPFFTTKKVGEGTGLGLSVVHGIVHQHDGYIDVQSEVGKGSTFIVCLPAVAAEPTDDVATVRMAPGGNERILFVDDEELLAEMGQEILEDFGYRVTAATNGMQALELFGADPGQFDLIITDVTMPEITGVELARQILQIRADVPIIMCTGFSHLIDAETAKAAGIKAFVAKPLTKREIARTIRNVLEGQRVRLP